MVKSFCKDCPNRHTICHDTCPQYQKYKLELKAENAYNQAMTGHVGVYHRDHEDRHREKGRKRFLEQMEVRTNDNLFVEAPG